MAVLKILTDDISREPCSPITVFDDELRKLAENMWDSMYAANGIGLAANQIGARVRVAVIDTLREKRSARRLVLVNPKIIGLNGQQIGQEGCLSMPGQYWEIPRAMSVLVEYRDLDGILKILPSNGFLARAIQHECDHLDGLLCNAKAIPSEAS